MKGVQIKHRKNAKKKASNQKLIFEKLLIKGNISKKRNQFKQEPSPIISKEQFGEEGNIGIA